MRLPPAPGAVVERPQDRAALLRLVSLLLRYPDAGLPAARPELRKAVAALPDGHPRQALEQFLWWFGDRQPLPLARHYVETFDLRRRSSLHLTSYLHGGARRRDMALLTLEQRYRVAGLTPPEGELPDFLPVVCEFAALAGPPAEEVGPAPYGPPSDEGEERPRASCSGRSSSVSP